MFKKKAGVASDNQVVLVMTLPAVLLMIVFVAVPLVMGVQISLTNWNGYSQDFTYNGLANYKKLFSENLTREIAAGCTLFGVHRDDINVQINNLSARAFASQGQQRSVVLALKLAEGEVCRDETGEYPVFLFDDVMSELDETRRGYVLRETGNRQVILTACESGGFDPRAVNMIGVENGIFTEQPRTEG